MLIDAHAHLNRYEEKLQSALEELTRRRIFTISNSMDPPSYQDNLRIGETCEFVLPTFGVHPRRAPRYADSLDELAGPIGRSPMIGEIGLDFHWVEDRSQYPAQEKVFDFFLEAAKTQDKIVNLHTKGAERLALDMLVGHGITRAIVHWYSGPLEILRAMIDEGYHFTVGVEALRSEHIRAIARIVPMGQLLTETDNPGGQKWLAGTVGMPHLIERVIETIAEIKKTHPDDVARTIDDNFLALIRHDLWLSQTRDWFLQHRDGNTAEEREARER